MASMQSAMAATADERLGAPSKTTVAVPKLSVTKRLVYTIITFLVQHVLLRAVTTASTIKQLFITPPDAPTLVKTYPVRKHLPIR